MSSEGISVDDRLRHMQEAIDRATDYLGHLTLEALQQDRKTIDAILRNLIILGEASKYIPPLLRRHYGHPWRVMGDTRNRIVHDYSVVDLQIVWNIVRVHLPELRDALSRMLDETGAGA